MTPAEARARHADIAYELSTAHRLLATERGAERQKKHAVFLDLARKSEGTDKIREHVAGSEALVHTNEVWKLEGDIAALEEERDDIRWQYAVGGYVESDA